MPSPRPLAESFYNRDVSIVARELLGRKLIRVAREGVMVGRIVETEAYLAAGDSACHAAKGPTRRNASMFGPPGRAYVYAIHSRWCLNAVTEAAGIGSAVLIRAVEPLEGIELMQERRGRESLLELARGPGRLCQALAIDRALDGWELTRGDTLWIAAQRADLPSTGDIAVSSRIGVTAAHDLPLRCYIRGTRYVSGRRS
jgi:DNA-3-methyladenine glycosylase